MKKVLKWIGIILLVGVIGVAVFAFTMIKKTESRLSHAYEITPEALAIVADPASLARGAHLAQAICTARHGNDLGGLKFFEDAALATIYTPNLTKGQGGVGDDRRGTDRRVNLPVIAGETADHRIVTGLQHPVVRLRSG